MCIYIYIYRYSIDLQYYTCTYATTVLRCARRLLAAGQGPPSGEFPQLLAPAAPRAAILAPATASEAGEGPGRLYYMYAYICLYTYTI